jgi:D-arabinose 1-dehydrogenase-like Zn-dependent alcohol dehydrogenase
VLRQRLGVLHETFPLEEAESALAKLRRGEVRGAAVLTLR